MHVSAVFHNFHILNFPLFFLLFIFYSTKKNEKPAGKYCELYFCYCCVCVCVCFSDDYCLLFILHEKQREYKIDEGKRIMCFRNIHKMNMIVRVFTNSFSFYFSFPLYHTHFLFFFIDIGVRFLCGSGRLWVVCQYVLGIIQMMPIK